MRREFPAKVKVAAFERAKGKCESCCVTIRHSGHYDHRIPDGLGGEPTLENCQLLCRTCHGIKTTETDVPTIAKSKRTRARHIGAEKRKGWRKPPAGYNPWTRRIERE